MFTGLVEETGVVRGLRKSGSGYILDVGATRVLEKTKPGDSIAINGACQTVIEIGKGHFSVFVSVVTASLTTLGDFKNGTEVNLERAMLPESRFGGHIVQGHVDGTGEISSINRDSGGVEITVEAEKDILKYIVAKGSVTVDGISLTVVNHDEGAFTLYLIPETIANTTAEKWKVREKVNIEVDILAKYVEKMLQNSETGGASPGNNEKLKRKLMEEGFV